ncbi:MAG: helix-turn-helix domain-containing protein [Actinobacteria bacterium]|nr:helix-turn-helix domain-containing protein [Actinomycetota bacterium]
MAGPRQQELPGVAAAPDGTLAINGRCFVRTVDQRRVVLVGGIPVAQYDSGDRMAEAYAVVSLVEQGHAEQVEVARAFGVSTRTVRRYQERFDAGGLAALGRPGGYPKGRPRPPRSRAVKVSQFKGEGVPNREIGRRLGITEKAVRKRLARAGWPKERGPVQASLPLGPGADPNLSGPVVYPVETPPVAPPPGADPNLSGLTAPPVAEPAPPQATADPPAAADDGALSVSFDTDPADRRIDRLLAYWGLLDDAAPLFRAGERVPHAGVLLAVPALVQSGVLDVARKVYGSIGPAFYGLRTTMVTLVLLALLRIKRPEALKERSPSDLGRLLGLDRAPEVKTLRRKLRRLAASGRAVEFGRLLAERRIQTIGAAVGFLYADGHVRVYHGKRTLPKAHVARMRIALPATTDYWVGDSRGDPLFVVTAEANAGMVKMLPPLLDEVRALVGERRITIVFDRGGYSPKLFLKLIAAGFDILTYRKGRFRKVPRKRFRRHKAVIDGCKVDYLLADQTVRLLGGKLPLRQVTRLSENGHQTPILTSRWDLPTVEVAFRMFERWRQENFFKYMREELALDALLDYNVEPADPARDVPNPVWNELSQKLRVARAEVARLSARYGLQALVNLEAERPTMRGFKIANARLAKPLVVALQRYTNLEARRARVPRRVPVEKVVEGDVVKLDTERKHLSNVLKMVAYQVESDLLRQIAPHYARVDDEGRTLLQTAFAGAADIAVDAGELRITLAPLSSPHRTRVIATLCDELNRTATLFPGTNLRLRYAVVVPT